MQVVGGLVGLHPATAKFIAGPVARRIATASGRVTPAVRTGTPIAPALVSIACRVAIDDWVEIDTAWLGSEARRNLPSFMRPPNTAIGSANRLTVKACQRTITVGFSEVVSALVIRNEAANMGEDDNMIRVYRPSLPPNLGATMISTPPKPSKAAIQRSARMRSFKNHAAPSMMNIGPVKPSAVMSAKPMCGKAVNHNMSPMV